MIGGLWMNGMDDLGDAVSQRARSMGTSPDVGQRFKELEHQIARLALLNQALWELLRDKLGVSDQDLEQIARRIDLRDGVEDGKITVTPMECPTCGRVSSSKHWKCLYCGQLFEKPVMG